MPQSRPCSTSPRIAPGNCARPSRPSAARCHQFFFTVGAFDGLAIVEFPDNESCAACRLTLTGSGANRALTTTILLSPAEGQSAMQKARGTQTGYQSPVNYGGVDYGGFG